MTDMIQKSGNLTDNFSILPNAMLNDNLSWQAKGMLAYLCSKPTDWKVSVQQLVNHTKTAAKRTGRDGVYSILKELIEAGYVRRERTQGDGYSETVYFVSDHSEKQLPDKPLPDNPDQDKTTLQRTDNNKELIITNNDQFEEFWKVWPKKVAKAKAKASFKAALKKITFDELMSHCRAYANFRRGQDQQFTLHATTWLNGERWNDDPPAPSFAKPSQGRSVFGQVLEDVRNEFGRRQDELRQGFGSPTGLDQPLSITDERSNQSSKGLFGSDQGS